MIGRRLRAAHDSVASLAVDPVEARLAAALLRLAKREGARGDKGVTLPFHLTRQSLADMTGTTVETAIRTLSRWIRDGVLDDDGIDRGLMFAFVGAHPGRQFEFVQSQWINDGVFIGTGNDKDPIIGSPEVNVTVPRRPVRKRLQGLPQFVVTRGGEYCFMPGLRALRWLANLES